MSDDGKVEVKVNATTTGLEAGMRNAAASVQSGVNEMKHAFKGIGEAIESAMAPLKLFAAVLAGGAVFKSAIEDTVAFTGEVVMLSKKMGLTTDQATKLNIGLKLIGATSDDYVNAAMKMDRQLKKNEAGLQAMGIATRDASGHFLDQQTLMNNGLSVLMKYKEGTDRNLASTDLFGRSFDEISKLMKLNNGVMEEAARLQKAYNIEVTGDGIQAVKDYKMSLAAMKIALGAIEDAIGKAVIPIINKLGAWFRGEGPGAIGAFIKVIEYLGEVFKITADMATDMVKTIVDVFQFMGKVTTDTIGGMPKEFTLFQIAMQTITVVMLELRFTAAAVFGDIAVVAKIAISEVQRLSDSWLAFQRGGDIGAAWSAGAQRGADIVAEQAARIKKLDEETKAAIARTLSGEVEHKASDDAPKAPKGTRDYKPMEDSKPDKDNRLKQWEAELVEKKTLYMRENDMREMSFVDEKAYWDRIGQLSDIGKNAGAVRKKSAEADFAEMKRQSKERAELQMEEIAQKEKFDTEGIVKDKAASDQRLALGIITTAQAIEAELGFEEQKMAIAEKALVDKIELMSKDPTKNAVEIQKLNDQLLLLEQKHSDDVLKIQNKLTLEQQKNILAVNSTIKSSFKTAITGMLDGTLTFAGAMKGLFKGILGAFIDMIGTMGAEWIMSLITKKVTQAAAAVSMIMSNAAVGASAAWASTAAIPIIGPELAPAAAAATYAGIAALAPSAAASSGYDIPMGVNPVVQAHQQEMILPAKQANVIRDMAEGGGGAGGATNITIHALDGASVARLFKENGRALVDSLRNQSRNFAT